MDPQLNLGKDEEAGRGLAALLAKFTTINDVIVLALSRGGIPVGAALASILNKRFDIMLMRKITVQHGGRRVIGAMTADGVRMLDYATIDRLDLNDREINDAILKQSLKLARLSKHYCGGRQYDVADQTAILVDDGLTPLTTILDAIRLLRRQHAERIVVALVIASYHTAYELRMEGAEVVMLAETEDTVPMSRTFKKFPRATHAGVRELLSSS